MFPRMRANAPDQEPVPVMPVLAAGRHASPTDGGCFMEIASLLAGETWSDYPATTDPVLALLARAVNDYTSDAGRRDLVPLIPDVVGTNTGDPRVPITVVALVADYALTHGSQAHADTLRETADSVRRLDPPDPDMQGMRAWHRRRRCRTKARSMARPVIGCAVSDLACTGETRADFALGELLRAAIAATRRITHPGEPSLAGDGSGLAMAARRVTPTAPIGIGRP